MVAKKFGKISVGKTFLNFNCIAINILGKKASPLKRLHLPPKDLIEVSAQNSREEAFSALAQENFLQEEF